jgi:SAM-dependent methyltransferase
VKVVFNDLTVNRPVSSSLGCDRGTPVDRYYIEKFLAAKAALVRGRVMEVGEDLYSRRFGKGQVESFSVLNADGKATKDDTAVIAGDLTDPATLPEATVDCFICTQTFNFIFDVGKAIQGAHALLKPGGVLLATVAGISQISRYDMARWGDYWRFTTASIEKLFAPVFTGGLQIETFGNVLAATAFLQGLAVEDLPKSALLDEIDDDYQLIIAIVARKA